MEAGRSETEKVRRSNGDDDECRAELGWDGDRYQRPEIRGWNDMVVTDKVDLQCESINNYQKVIAVVWAVHP
jgi:hypothetical protein